MKVIDLLNKIANGEKLPKKIKVYEVIYTLDEDTLNYMDEDNKIDWLSFIDGNELTTYEVEIIEAKKIRKLDFIEENTFSKRQNGMTSEDRRLLDSNFKELGNKINEIIDYLEENKNEK